MVAFPARMERRDMRSLRSRHPSIIFIQASNANKPFAEFSIAKAINGTKSRLATDEGDPDTRTAGCQ